MEGGGGNQEKLIGDIVGWDAVASAWCRFYEEGDPWDRWAEQLLIPLLNDGRWMSTEERWSLVLSLLDSAPSEKVLATSAPVP